MHADVAFGGVILRKQPSGDIQGWLNIELFEFWLFVEPSSASRWTGLAEILALPAQKAKRRTPKAGPHSLVRLAAIFSRAIWNSSGSATMALTSTV
jgi:hypothetical protein